MNRKFLALFIVSPLAVLFAGDSQPAFKYPSAPASNQIDDYFGTKVPDPYRPLENPDSPESRKWIEAEDKITFDFLKTIPERDGIKKRLTEVWDYERFGVPFKEKGRYFFSKNIGTAKPKRALHIDKFLRTSRDNFSIRTLSRKMARSR